MNISEMLTATTTANVSSGVRRPCRSLLSTWIGWLIVDRTRPRDGEVLSRERRRTC